MSSLFESKHPNSPYLTEEWRKHAWNKETVSWLLSRHDWNQVEKFMEFWDDQFMNGALYKGVDQAIAVPTPTFILHLLHAWAYNGQMKDEKWAKELLASDSWEELLIFVDSAARDGGEGRSANARGTVRLFKHLLHSSAYLTEERFEAAAPSVFRMSQNTIEDLIRFYKNPSMPQSILRRDVANFITEVKEAHDNHKPWNVRDSKSKLPLLLAHASGMENDTFGIFGKFLIQHAKLDYGPKDVGVRQLLMQVNQFPASRPSGVAHLFRELQKAKPSLLAVTGYRFEYHTYDNSDQPCLTSSKCYWEGRGQTVQTMEKWWKEFAEEVRSEWFYGLNDRRLGPFYCQSSVPLVAKLRASFVEEWLSRRTGGEGEDKPFTTQELFMVCFMGVKVEGVYDALGDDAGNIPAAWLEELLG